MLILPTHIKFEVKIKISLRYILSLKINQEQHRSWNTVFAFESSLQKSLDLKQKVQSLIYEVT